MSWNNVSSPIAANQYGWFRYNYDQNRLEFINDETKTVAQTWDIPADQWERIPSKREYCENILRQYDRHATAQKQTNAISVVVLVISVIVAVFCWFVLYDSLYNTSYNTINCIVGSIAIVSAITSLFRIKK